jgi:hypothetical protein
LYGIATVGVPFQESWKVPVKALIAKVPVYWVAGELGTWRDRFKPPSDEVITGVAVIPKVPLTG